MSRFLAHIGSLQMSSQEKCSNLQIYVRGFKRIWYAVAMSNPINMLAASNSVGGQMSALKLLTCMFCLVVIGEFAYAASNQTIFVGTAAKQDGIYASSIDLHSGEFSPAKAVGDASRPTFLAVCLIWQPVEHNQKAESGLMLICKCIFLYLI